MPSLSVSVTQGGADAFVQASMQTGLEGQVRQAFKILQASWEWTNNGLPSSASPTNLEIAISRRTKAAMPLISDNDVIYKWLMGWRVLTSGIAVYEGIQRWQPMGDVFIVEDPVYIQVDSAATAQANNIVLRIDYDIVTLTELERLTLLTQSLQ
jgi:hypothetical protein